MAAKVQQLRKATAKELATKFGVSERTIRAHVAAPRHWWVEHRRAVRETAAKLREQGRTWEEVASMMGVTVASARALAKRARGEWGVQAKERHAQPTDTLTGDLFQP